RGGGQGPLPAPPADRRCGRRLRPRRARPAAPGRRGPGGGGAVRPAAHAQAPRRDARRPRHRAGARGRLRRGGRRSRAHRPSRPACRSPTPMWRGADMPRIVAGRLGGRTIPGPPGKGTRPTSDKVREALFNRLEGWDALAGARVLDLYAGTGALAFEAVSRGAEHALLVEMHGPTVAQLRRTASDLGLSDCVEIRAGKAATAAGRLAAAREDGAEVPAVTLVFLDPPYDVPTEALEQMLVALR